MKEKLRKTSIDIVGDVPWGTHFCQFYETKKDLIEILVPYFKMGLENNEFCMWVTSEPLSLKEAKKALKKEVKNLDGYIKKGQIEILDYSQWYTKLGHFNSEQVLQGWIEKEKQAIEKGFDGLRLTGNTFWLEEKDWRDFTEYEASVNSAIGKYRMLAVCTYSLEKCRASDIVDVVSNHQFALFKREGKWEIIESAEHKKTAEALRRSEERYALAQRAANIGSWDWDIRTGDLVWSEQIEPMFGFGRDEFGATYEAFLGCVHPEDRQHVIDSVNACVEEGKDYAIEHRIVWPDETIRWVSETGNVVRDEDGKAIRMLGVVQDITERKRWEEALQWAKRELTVRNKIAEIFLTIPDEEIFGEVLQVILDAMESNYGVFGYIDEHGVLIIPSMTRDIWEECQVSDKTIAYPREKWGGIWGRALVEKRSLFANEGLHVPKGHVSITRTLFVPVMYGKQVIGLLGVANKSTDYGQKDQEFLETIAGKIAPILNARLQRDREERERKQAEEALWLHEARLESLLELNKMAGASQREILDFVREEVIKVTQSKLAFIGFMNEDESVMTIDNWSKEVMAQCVIVDKQMRFPITKAGLWAEAVRHRKPIIINDYTSAGQYKKGYPNGHVPIKRFLCVPVFDGERIVMVAAAANKEMDYEESDVRAFTSMMNDTWRLLQRKQAEEDLEKYKQHLEELVQARTEELTQANKQLMQEIEECNRLERALLDVSEREQRRIGRELHDSIGQQLTGIAFMAKVLEQRLAAKLPDEATNVAEMAKLVKQAMDQTRGLAKGLHPVDLDSGSLMSALQEFAAATEHLFGVCCTYKCDKAVHMDDAAVVVHLYRIAQEAVTNAIKHGRARNIQIELAYDRDESVLRVKSDGTDFPGMQVKGKGMGLQIMEHRAEMICGSLDIRKGDGGGTIVTCVFPNKISANNGEQNYGQEKTGS